MAALTEAVLPWTARFDVQRSCSHIRQPLAQFLRYEFRAIVRPNMLRDSSPQHHIGQCLDHLIAAKPASHPNRQTLPRVFVDQHQHPQRSSVVCHRTHEIVAPHVVRSLRPQPHARPVIQPQPSPRPLFSGHFQPFPAPDALHPILAYLPPCHPQQRRDSPVAVAAVLTGQGNDRSGQRIFVHSLDRQVALCSAPLLHQSASMPLGEFILLPRMLDRRATPLRA